MSRQMNSPKDVGDLSTVVIDSLEFSREGRALRGKVAVAALGRLADEVVDPAGVLQCTLRGLPAEDRRDGKSGLEVEVSGALKLRCQRCLQPMDFPLHMSSRLLLVAPGEPWPDDGDDLDDIAAGSELDDEWDAIEASREQSVLALIEEEVLLALPIVPKHMACKPPVELGNEDEPSPFAALAKLKLQ